MHTDYQPEVNDYVIWETTTPDKNDEGWVYFHTGDMPPDFNNNQHSRYITIETGIKPRPVCETEAQLGNKINHPKHKYIHTLLLCFESDWCNLKYIHSRPNCKSKDYYNRFEIDDTK